MKRISLFFKILFLVVMSTASITSCVGIAKKDISDDLLRDRIIACAGGYGENIGARLGVEYDLLKKTGEIGSSFKKEITATFFELLPKSDRLDGYKAYLNCLGTNSFLASSRQPNKLPESPSKEVVTPLKFVDSKGEIPTSLESNSRSTRKKVEGCSAILKSKLPGSTKIRIFTSPSRSSNSFPYQIAGENYVSVKGEYEHMNGSWFKVVYVIDGKTKNGWVHERNIGVFTNC